ncbi:hypothetical protein [Nostoc sp.]
MAVVKNTSFVSITHIFATWKCSLSVSLTEALRPYSFLVCTGKKVAIADG